MYITFLQLQKSWVGAQDPCVWPKRCKSRHHQFIPFPDVTKTGILQARLIDFLTHLSPHPFSHLPTLLHDFITDLTLEATFFKGSVHFTLRSGKKGSSPISLLPEKLISLLLLPHMSGGHWMSKVLGTKKLIKELIILLNSEHFFAHHNRLKSNYKFETWE